ncbi:hypothetical protein N0V90_012989 [Kalmusia sp. IMI 367209]|nr:hypothetical protein N0V90_012989 [Kalmusia sp. IMI 367209]
MYAFHFCVPRYPNEDEKLRAASHSRRRGGNCANTLEVLTQLIHLNDESITSPQLHLHLISVLPAKDSVDVQFIRNSLPNVKIDDGCIFREDQESAASSYIIQAIENNSRTIVSHVPLTEMTTQEFTSRASTISGGGEARRDWYHFEGRIPDVTGESVRWLRENLPSTRVSVECEKPERKYMELVSRDADVVFFSKLWAQNYDLLRVV